MNIFDLTGRVAVVTGASSGIGADAARGYVQQGAAVALFARRDDKLKALAAELEAAGGRALPVQCDVSDEESVKTAVKKVLSVYGKIDILLNNAGTNILGAVHQMKLDDWNKVVATNLTGDFLTCKYVIPGMMENHYGRIVNIASVNAIVADKDDAIARHVYNATKGGVVSLTIGMAATYAKYGITVNAVGPGLFETEMTGPLFETPEFMQFFEEKCPTGRPGRKGELNGPILFLSSDAASYTNGQFLCCDGADSVI